MPSGPNQHYLPRFSQKNFGIRPKCKDIWVFHRGAAPEQMHIKNVGSSDYFHSLPEPDGSRTLDDEITEVERVVSDLLNKILKRSIGSIVESSDAAKIVDHLVPRTAHFRKSMQSGFDVLSDKIKVIFGDEYHVGGLFGLHEDEPSEQFCQYISPVLDKLVEKNGATLPRPVIERILFCIMKENGEQVLGKIFPMLANLFGDVLKRPDFARDGHNKIVMKSLHMGSRFEFLEGLKWTIRNAPSEGAILPDFVALAIDKLGSARPAMFADLADIAAIVLPINPIKLLVGEAINCGVWEKVDFNEEAALNSYDFFLASMITDRLGELHKRIGERSVQLIEDSVNNAMMPYFSVSRPIDSGDTSTEVDGDSAKNSTSWNYELSFVGYEDEEKIKEISKVIQSMVAEFFRKFPLNRFDGITVCAVNACEYEGADTSCISEEFSREVLRVVLVRREENVRRRIIIDVECAYSLIDEIHENREADIYNLLTQLLLSKLAEIFVIENIEKKTPHLMAQMCENSMYEFLYPAVHGAIISYISSFIEEKYFREISFINENKYKQFMKSLDVMKNSVPVEISEHLCHGNFEKLFEAIFPSIDNFLRALAATLGYYAAIGDNVDDDNHLLSTLERLGLRQWCLSFHRQLDKIRGHFGQWEAPSEFLTMSLHVERLLWHFGIFPWNDSGGVRIEIALSTDIEKLLQPENDGSNDAQHRMSNHE